MTLHPLPPVIRYSTQNSEFWCTGFGQSKIYRLPCRPFGPLAKEDVKRRCRSQKTDRISSVSKSSNFSKITISLETQHTILHFPFRSLAKSLKNARRSDFCSKCRVGYNYCKKPLRLKFQPFSSVLIPMYHLCPFPYFLFSRETPKFNFGFQTQKRTFYKLISISRSPYRNITDGDWGSNQKNAVSCLSILNPLQKICANPTFAHFPRPNG